MRQSFQTALRALSTARPAQAAASGKLHICGTAEYHKLGFGDSADREVPTAVEALAAIPIAHVACGKYHSAAVSAEGDVYAWGLESSGQLGLGSARTKAHTPRKVDALCRLGVTQLSCGSYHTLALTGSGEVYSTGFGGSFVNGAGGLGHGDRGQLDTPKRIAQFGHGEGRLNAIHVSAGEWGRLGFGDSSDVLVPQRLDKVCEDISPSIARVGEAHSACIGANGKLYTWGRNEHWQLGYEVTGLLNSGQSFDAQAEPAAVPLPEGSGRVVDVACGELGTAVLLEDDSVLLWGMRRYFEPTRLPGTGPATTGDVAGGVKVEGKIAQLEIGATHVALRTECGRVYTYGSGTALGLPKSERRAWELAEVKLGGRRALQVACGSNSTALLLEA